MGTLAEYSMIMMVMSLVITLTFSNAIQPLQARIADVRGAAATVSGVRIVASLEETGSWQTASSPARWNSSLGDLAYSNYSVIGESSSVRYAFSPKAKQLDSSLSVPQRTCANFYDLDSRIFSVPCISGTYIIQTGDWSLCKNHQCVVQVSCASEAACEIQWWVTINNLIVRQSVVAAAP